MSIYATLLAVSASVPGGANEIDQASKKADGGVFPPLDVSTYSSQLFWLFLTFGLLLFLLSKVLLPRLGGILEERSNRIADDLDSAARMQREAEAAGKAYEQSLADARAKAHNVSETTRASVTSELEAEMQAADEQASKHLAEAEAKIQKTRASALTNVDDIAIQTTQAVVEHLFAKKFSVLAVRKAVKALD